MRNADYDKAFFIKRMVRVGHRDRQCVIEYRSRLFERYTVVSQI